MIKLIDNLFIDVDDFNYTLKEDRGKVGKDGRPLSNVIGYYGSLKQAFNGAKDYYIAKSLSDEVLSLEQALECVRQANEKFEKLFDGVKG